MAPGTAEAAMILEKPALFEIGLVCESLESVVVILHDDADGALTFLLRCGGARGADVAGS